MESMEATISKSSKRCQHFCAGQNVAWWKYWFWHQTPKNISPKKQQTTNERTTKKNVVCNVSLAAVWIELSSSSSASGFRALPNNWVTCFFFRCYESTTFIDDETGISHTKLRLQLTNDVVYSPTLRHCNASIYFRFARARARVQCTIHWINAKARVTVFAFEFFRMFAGWLISGDDSEYLKMHLCHSQTLVLCKSQSMEFLVCTKVLDDAGAAYTTCFASRSAYFVMHE